MVRILSYVEWSMRNYIALKNVPPNVVREIVLKHNFRSDMGDVVLLSVEEEKYFKPKFGERYWYIDKYCKVGYHYWSNEDTDTVLLQNSNVFRTREEAQFQSDKRRFLLQLERDFADNSDEIDWDDNSLKFHIVCYPTDKTLDITGAYLTSFGVPITTNREWLEQYIHDNREDILRYYFEVEVRNRKDGDRLMRELETQGATWFTGHKPSEWFPCDERSPLNVEEGKLVWSRHQVGDNTPSEVIFNPSKLSTTYRDSKGATTIKLRSGDVWDDYTAFCIAYTQHHLKGHKGVLHALEHATRHGVQIGDRVKGVHSDQHVVYGQLTHIYGGLYIVDGKVVCDSVEPTEFIVGDLVEWKSWERKVVSVGEDYIEVERFAHRERVPRDKAKRL